MGDDENDTLLFERWEKAVIEKFPNPQRIGCPGYEILKQFVETPGAVGLAELNDTHITRCRECVLDLRELRRLREERNAAKSAPAGARRRKVWATIIATAAVCLILVDGALVWRAHIAKTRLVPVNEAVNVDLDLSGNDVERGADAETTPVASFPRRVINLHLILPYYSPGGDYRITVQRDRKGGPVQMAEARAVAQGPHTSLEVRLDFRNVTAGRHYLGTTHDGEPTYLYAITVN